MYPVVRLFKERFKYASAPDLAFDGVHVSEHRCWPQDIDVFMEMNNGRILTILDLGRFILGKRTGLEKALMDNKWGITVAGSSVRYRRRIRPLSKFKVRTGALGWDARFFYLEQTLWVGEDCAVQALFRSAITDKNGLVPPARMIKELGVSEPSPTLPAWVANWIAAEDTRPWPPEPLTPTNPLATPHPSMS
jgi:acyl-CoA thioesterase FadM